MRGTFEMSQITLTVQITVPSVLQFTHLLYSVSFQVLSVELELGHG